MRRVRPWRRILAGAGLATALAAWAPAAPAQADAASPAAAASAPDRPPHAALLGASPLGRCLGRPPSNPQEALRNGLEGRAVVAFTATESGGIEGITLLQSSGHALLDESLVGHLTRCVLQHRQGGQGPLQPGRYALPMLWRIE